MQIESQLGPNSYRNRAQERRKQYGTSALSGYELKHDDANAPIEQPTANGIKSDNKDRINISQLYICDLRVLI